MSFGLSPSAMAKRARLARKVPAPVQVNEAPPAPPKQAPVAPPAYTAGVGYTYAGQREAHDKNLDAIRAAAERFWDQRNTPANYQGPLKMYVADSLAGNDTEGYQALARGAAPYQGDPAGLFLDARWSGAKLQQLQAKKARVRQEALKELYRVMVHEMGHVRGLQHSEDGIMSEGGAANPGDWAALARQLGIPIKPKKRLRPGRGEG